MSTKLLRISCPACGLEHAFDNPPKEKDFKPRVCLGPSGKACGEDLQLKQLESGKYRLIVLG